MELIKQSKNLILTITTIIRWRSEFKKHGEYGLKWGNGKQATTHKHKRRREKNVDINLMSREELIEYINLSEDIKKFVVLSKKKKFRIICDLRRKYNVKWMCKILEISYSGFYNWIKLGYSKFNKWDKTLEWIIKSTYLFYNQKYGYRLLTKLINKMWNLNMADHIVYRYMKNLGIKSVINKKTKFKYPDLLKIVKQKIYY